MPSRAPTTCVAMPFPHGKRCNNRMTCAVSLRSETVFRTSPSPKSTADKSFLRQEGRAGEHCYTPEVNCKYVRTRAKANGKRWGPEPGGKIPPLGPTAADTLACESQHPRSRQKLVSEFGQCSKLAGAGPKSCKLGQSLCRTRSTVGSWVKP